MINIAKLNEVLKCDFSSEKDVLHLLVLLRKVIEGHDKEKYRVIKFYANWAVHDEIEDLKDFKPFFLEVDDEAKKYLKFPNSKTRHFLNEKIASFTSLIKLKEQLHEFIIQNKLICEIIEDEKKWLNFVKYFRELILNHPLVFKNINKKLPDLKISVFMISEISPIMMGDFKALYWQLWIKNSTVPMSCPIEDTVFPY